jgi:SAM-dependent methyltransferase
VVRKGRPKGVRGRDKKLGVLNSTTTPSCGCTTRCCAAHAESTAMSILDIGCGTGQTTRDAARMAPAGSELGVDISASVIERARELARWVRNSRPSPVHMRFRMWSPRRV